MMDEVMRIEPVAGEPGLPQLQVRDERASAA
jgi:hypothetical protein